MIRNSFDAIWIIQALSSKAMCLQIGYANIDHFVQVVIC